MSEDVESIIKAAETEAADIRREAERDAHRLVADARAEVERSRLAASRELEGVAAARIAKILELRRLIDERARALVESAGAGTSVLAQLGALVEALAERADRIAREAAIERPRVEPAPEAESSPVESPAERPPEPAVADPAAEHEAAPAAAASDADPAAAAAADGAEPDQPRTRRFVRKSEPSVETLRWARLTAYRMAIDGSSRGAVEESLVERFELADAAVLLDDVFGPDEVTAGR